MLIRVSVIRAVIPRTGEGIAFVRGEIQPEIAAMGGNRGFVMAVDHVSGRYISLTAWTDDEAVKVNANRAASLMSDAARRLGGGEPSVEVFDLVLAHAVKPVRVGYWGRLTRAEVAVDDLDRAVLRFRETALPLFERYEGLAAVDLLVNWVSGEAESVVWFDSLQVLRHSRSRAQEMRNLLAADVPTLKIVEVAELEVVIAEMGADSANRSIWLNEFGE